MSAPPDRNSSCDLLVAAQLCDARGVRRTDEDAVGALRDAAAALLEQERKLLREPGRVASDGVLMVVPASPEDALECLLIIEAATAPEPTTYCLAVAAPPGVLRERAGSADATTPTRRLEAALIEAHAAETAARAGLAGTDPRDARVRVLASEPAPALAAALDLLLEAYRAMTDRQRQIVQLVKSRRTQQDVATHLGVSRQAVNQSLTSARWGHIEAAGRRIARSLDALCERDRTSRREGG